MQTQLSTEERERLSEIYKQLSHPLRLQIVMHLQQGPACVSELCELSAISQSATSQHLKQLKQSRIVKQERRGQQVYYSLQDRHIETLLATGIAHVKGDACDDSTT